MIVLTLLVAAAVPVPASPSPAADRASSTGHLFLCGDDEPPTGPYLHAYTDSLWHYDCLTQTLIPLEAGQSEYGCVRNEAEQPLAGVCALVKGADRTYTFRFFVALVGGYDHGQGIVHDHGAGNVHMTCEDAVGACRPSMSPVDAMASGMIGFAGLGVRFLDHQGVETIDACHGPISLRADLAVWGPTGKYSLHGERAQLCA